MFQNTSIHRVSVVNNCHELCINIQHRIAKFSFVRLQIAPSKLLTGFLFVPFEAAPFSIVFAGNKTVEMETFAPLIEIA